MQDWKIYRRRQVFEILASVFQSSRHDPPLRKLILKVRLSLRRLASSLILTLCSLRRQFLVRATSLPTAARELLSRNGLLGWLAAQVPLDVAERRLLVQVVAQTAEVLPFEQVTGVADAVEALENAVGNEGAPLLSSLSPLAVPSN